MKIILMFLLTVISVAIPIVLTTTAASGTGTVVTLKFRATAKPAFDVGSVILVSDVIPSGYNGKYTVLSCSDTTVTYANTTTGNQTQAGTIIQGDSQ